MSNRWHEFDERFYLERQRNEGKRFGWVVEIDPWQPSKAPLKRTALGRFKHQGATVTLARDGRVVVCMGDDERFEYLYPNSRGNALASTGKAEIIRAPSSMASTAGNTDTATSRIDLPNIAAAK